MWLGAMIVALPHDAVATPESATLRMRAYDLAFNLDYEEAVRTMTAAVTADPNDAAAHRGLASIAWLWISFRRGTVSVDEYLGKLTGQIVQRGAPPPDLAGTFNTHIDRATALATTAVAAKPRDPDAHYQLGASVALRASYIATIEGGILRAFRMARHAYNESETAFDLDASRTDASLVVGMYRYLVSVMPLPMRMLAYVAGFGGGTERGIEMVERAASRASEAQADARFALVLLYNREARYADAMRQLAELQRAFPRNRLLWLEAGATALRAGRAADAEQQLDAGLRMLGADRRPRMFGEEALWYEKRGAARVALNRLDEASSDLTRAGTGEGRAWVRGRAYIELGKIADLRRDRAAARVRFQQGLLLCEQDNDITGADAARRWIDMPFGR